MVDLLADFLKRNTHTYTYVFMCVCMWWRVAEWSNEAFTSAKIRRCCKWNSAHVRWVVVVAYLYFICISFELAAIASVFTKNFFSFFLCCDSLHVLWRVWVAVSFTLRISFYLRQIMRCRSLYVWHLICVHQREFFFSFLCLCVCVCVLIYMREIKKCMP